MKVDSVAKKGAQQGANKVALITGAARRIGAAITRKFHHQGYTVILHCNNSRSAADALAAQLNTERVNSASVVQADLNNAAAITQLVTAVLEQHSAIDVLVNNASGFYPTPFAQVTDVQWQDLMASNLKGAFFLSQQLSASLTGTRGSIVNIADIHADRGLRNYSVYSIAKTGLLGMTRALALELAPDVRVNAVSPGTILWPEHDESDATLQQKIVAQIPLAAMGQPQDIANAVWFLAAQASYITGTVIRVDGGHHLNL